MFGRIVRLVEMGLLPSSGRAFRTSGGWIFGWGATVPANGTSGYTVGALFYDTNAAAGSALWVNTGTSTSSTFAALRTGATIAVADANGNMTGTNVEAVLNEHAVHIQSAQHFIPIPLTCLREVNSNDIPAVSDTPLTDDPAGFGGLLCTNTTPTLEYTSGDTDSALRVLWAASNNDPVVFQTPLPPNLDVSADLVLHIRGEMGGATDTPAIDLDSYFNEGDTKVSDATAAFADAIGEVVATIAAADIPSGAQSLTCELTPQAHTTDALIIYSMWLEYTGLLLTS